MGQADGSFAPSKKFGSHLLRRIFAIAQFENLLLTLFQLSINIGLNLKHFSGNVTDQLGAKPFRKCIHAKLAFPQFLSPYGVCEIFSLRPPPLVWREMAFVVGPVPKHMPAEEQPVSFVFVGC